MGWFSVASICAHPAKRAADNKIYAQSLVHRVLKRDAGLIWVGIHGISDDGNAHVIIASTLDVIGNADEPNDILVVTEGRTFITPNPGKSKLGIMMPLKDVSGNIVGALALAFTYQAGDDDALLFTKATRLRDQLASEISGEMKLYEPLADLSAPSSARR
ncbi:MAG: hypothetical protein JWM88_3543 [Verrucomicrobia bacterium]|nr:hypothetical protein [Verrucomicrobiota bacterium]